jgi:hypothetical protein
MIEKVSMIQLLIILHKEQFLLAVTYCFVQKWQKEKRRLRVAELLEEQKRLKNELADAKGRLMAEPNSWTYDCEYFLHQFYTKPFCL